MQRQIPRFSNLVQVVKPKKRQDQQRKSIILWMAIRAVCLAGMFLLLQAGAWAQTVTLSVTGPQSGTRYYAGDSFTLTVRGAANAVVTLSQNGGAQGQMGTTNSSGVLTLTGNWTNSNIGTYTQIWYVAGVAATPTLSFSISALPKEYIRANGRVIAIENH